MGRYPVLAFTRVALSIGGWLAIIIGVLMVLGGLGDLFGGHRGGFQSLDQGAQAWLRVISGFGLALTGLVVVAIAELLTVFVNIEINTRPTGWVAPSAAPIPQLSTIASTTPAGGVTGKGPLTWDRIRTGNVTRAEVGLGAVIVAVLLYLLISIVFWTH